MSVLELLCYSRIKLIGEFKMRELTEEELKLAPEWAYMYSLTSNNMVRFHNDFMFCLCNGYVITNVACAEPKYFNTRLINKKTFDATKHEFSDQRISFNGTLDVDIGFGCCGDSVSEVRNCDFSREDAIEIAKIFNLTEKDLKA
jgi:hypothetical protein